MSEKKEDSKNVEKVIQFTKAEFENILAEFKQSKSTLPEVKSLSIKSQDENLITTFDTLQDNHNLKIKSLEQDWQSQEAKLKQEVAKLQKNEVELQSEIKQFKAGKLQSKLKDDLKDVVPEDLVEDFINLAQIAKVNLSDQKELDAFLEKKNFYKKTTNKWPLPLSQKASDTSKTKMGSTEIDRIDLAGNKTTYRFED